MADDFRDYVAPISGSAPIDRLEGQGGGPPRQPKMAQSIAGRIVGIHRGVRRQGGSYNLDLSVGGDEFTEIVLRVPTGAYGNIEGKRAVIYIDE